MPAAEETIDSPLFLLKAKIVKRALPRAGGRFSGFDNLPRFCSTGATHELLAHTSFGCSALAWKTDDRITTHGWLSDVPRASPWQLARFLTTTAKAPPAKRPVSVSPPQNGRLTKSNSASDGNL